ncbi:MAG TPA: hypothetical protein VN920_04365 [Pyrinomonadaceae bacterium]|nr:hypothetical protein [Pyrinomonadaceae bacterium]
MSSISYLEMKLFFSIIVTVFAIMGMFALLELWANKFKLTGASLSQPRRSFLRLIASFVVGLLIGAYWWRRNKRANQELKLLFELELLLAQLEGLVNATLAQGDVVKLLPLIKTLVSKIGEYGSKTTRLLTELEEQLSPGDYYDLRLGASMIAHGLDHIENPTARDLQTDANNNPLITIQKGILLARTKTRELIDERISGF